MKKKLAIGMWATLIIFPLENYSVDLLLDFWFYFCVFSLYLVMMHQAH